MEEMRKWKDFVSGSEVLEIGNPESLFPPDCAETQSKHRISCLAAGQKQTRQIGPERAKGRKGGKGRESIWKLYESAKI